MNCQHPGCTCNGATVDRGGKKYCSDHCAGKGTSAEAHCGCGHPSCK